MKKIITTIILACVVFSTCAQFNGGIASGYASNGTNINVPLPVYTVELSANKLNNAHELRWTIISSSVVLNIDLEYSIDQLQWSSIYDEKSTNIFSNSYTNSSLAKTNYYRLKVTELDNSTSYSNTILLLEKEERMIDVYPNPVQNNLRINFTEVPYELAVYNSQGQIMLKRKINNEQIQISTKTWTAGTYYLNINNQITKSIIKQ